MNIEIIIILLTKKKKSPLKMLSVFKKEERERKRGGGDALQELKMSVEKMICHIFVKDKAKSLRF